MRYVWRIAVEIWRAVKFELLPTFGSLLTIFLAMLLPGMIWVVSINLSRAEYELRNNLTINVFLSDELSSVQVDSLKNRFLGMRGVTGANYVSRDQALGKMKERFGSEILEGLDENPLPPSFVLSVNEIVLEPEAADSVIGKLRGMTEVDDVVFAGEIVRQLGTILRTVKTLGFALAILVSFTAIFIVANTVRIAIADRRRTVEIMQLVGATRTYIQTPFVLLGGLMGITGAILSIIILGGISDYVSRNLVVINFLETHEILAFILTGLLLGMMGALVATQRHLRI
jgi:cell division transport system permease protein